MKTETMPTASYESPWVNDDVRLFRRSVRQFIEKELRLLDPARAAIARGDSAQALRLLDDYDRRFPDGSLQREAKVLRSSANPK